MEDFDREEEKKGRKKEGSKKWIILSCVAFGICVALCIVAVALDLVAPVIKTIKEIGVIKTILRLFGGAGAIMWCYVFYVICDKVYKKKENYALSVVVSLLALFCMMCTMFFLPG